MLFVKINKQQLSSIINDFVLLSSSRKSVMITIQITLLLNKYYKFIKTFLNFQNINFFVFKKLEH